VFFRGSRYAAVPTAEVVIDGRTVRYVRTRVITAPPVDRRHAVREADRPDLVAHTYLRDSEQFWRVCDANRALWPADLFAVPGVVIDIPAAGE
jgi:hypothetical protein